MKVKPVACTRTQWILCGVGLGIVTGVIVSIVQAVSNDWVLLDLLATPDQPPLVVDLGILHRGRHVSGPEDGGETGFRVASSQASRSEP